MFKAANYELIVDIPQIVAVWFFRRYSVEFVVLVIKKGRDWCYERGKEDRT